MSATQASMFEEGFSLSSLSLPKFCSSLGLFDEKLFLYPSKTHAWHTPPQLNKTNF